jgi:hypothetical protein
MPRYGRSVDSRPNRFAVFANSPKVAAGLLALTALVCGLIVVVLHGEATALRDHGVRAVGQVLEVHEGRDSYVVVRFQDAGGEVVVTDVANYRWDPAPEVGDRPELLYDPDDPAGNVADARMGPDFFTVWAVAIGGLIAAALVWPTWTGRLDWNKFRRY